MKVNEERKKSMELTIKIDPESINLIVSSLSDAILQATKDQNKKKFYNLKEIANIFNIKYPTIKTKSLPYPKEREGKQERYVLSEVKEYLGR